MKFHALIAAATLTFFVTGTAILAAETKRPNIVIFLSDDQSQMDSSVYDSPDMKTPNMKKLAENGMTFNRAFVASPSCAPSRAALLTGLYPIRNGAMRNHQFPNLAQKKWPDYFREIGYEVVAIGKVAHYNQVEKYNFNHSAFYKYHEDVCVDEAVKWLSARKSDKPLCFLVGTNWPHVPWPKEGAISPDKVHLPPMLVDTPETRQAWSRYAAAVENADRDLGKIYDTAQKILGNDTFFLFTADHGAQFPFHKWNCYNGGLRTPLIVSWAGKIQKNVRTDAMVSWIDILPTVLEVAGATPPPEKNDTAGIDGRSFLPVLNGTAETHRDFIFATHSGDVEMNNYPIRAVTDGRWTYIKNLAPEATHHTHVDRAGDPGYFASWVRKSETTLMAQFKVDRYFSRPAEELYDANNDPYDLHNLSTNPANEKTLAKMRAKLNAWMSDYGDKGMTTELEFSDKPQK